MFFKKYLQISLYILYAQRNDGLKVTYIKKVFLMIFFFSYRKYRGLDAKAWKPSEVGGKCVRGLGGRGAGATPSSCLFKDLQPQEPNARLVTQCQLCKSHQPTCIFLLLTTRPGGTQSPGGRGGRRRPGGAGAQEKVPGHKSSCRTSTAGSVMLASSPNS